MPFSYIRVLLRILFSATSFRTRYDRPTPAWSTAKRPRRGADEGYRSTEGGFFRSASSESIGNTYAAANVADFLRYTLFFREYNFGVLVTCRRDFYFAFSHIPLYTIRAVQMPQSVFQASIHTDRSVA